MMPVLVASESQVSDLVEEGVYPAKLVSVQEIANEFGPRLLFRFSLRGRGEGNLISVTTAPKFNRASKLAGIYKALSGNLPSPRDLSDGVDLSDLVGCRCLLEIHLKENQSGVVYPHVEHFLRLGSV